MSPAFSLPGGAGDPTVPSTWADPLVIGAAARKVLRMADNHGDASRVDSAARSAITAIDLYLDRGDDPITGTTPQPLIDAAIQVTTEMYRRKDAPFGVLDGWSDDAIGPVRIGSDPIKGVEELIRPYSHRYGVN